jgi:hypothetical protein
MRAPRSASFSERGKMALKEYLGSGQDPAMGSVDDYGGANYCDDNIVKRTTRKAGYSIVQLDWYEPE